VKKRARRPQTKRRGQRKRAQAATARTTTAALRTENAALRDQQAATSEILRVISRSPSDVQPVFDTMLQSAVRLLGGFGGTILRYDGDLVHLAAVTGGRPRPGTEDWFRSGYPRPMDPDQPSGQAIVERRVVQISDTEEHASEVAREIARRWQFRALLIVPMLREGAAVGTITVTRAAAGPFSDRQVELLQTFADQAVIAIENVRLFAELERKNRDLTCISRRSRRPGRPATRS
jgi:two-component system NtrC family sensor kinase